MTSRADAAAPPAWLMVAAPGLCAIHCLAAPALVVVAPALAENPTVELVLMGTSLAVGFGLAYGGVRRHGHRRLWLPVLLAAVLFAGAGAGVFEGAAELLATVGGSLLVLTTLGWDARLRRSCDCDACGCPAAVVERAER